MPEPRYKILHAFCEHRSLGFALDQFHAAFADIRSGIKLCQESCEYATLSALSSFTHTAAKMSEFLLHRRIFELLVIAVAFNASARAEWRTPYTESESEVAVPMGVPGVRAWADVPLSVLRGQVAHLPALNAGHQFSILALSGGGEHGAFGAGLLCGWSESGRRPTFDVVTGVSTGALMAPFAFLGSAYDQRLKALYTEVSFHSILSGSPLTGLFGEAFTISRPLQRVIARQVDQSMLADVAAAHRQGRRLFVVTTNLDAQRAVLWNMGAIAASGQQSSLDLFRKVILASACVPGLFDPVLIESEANGRRFKEMHVDGGTAFALFAVPLKLLAASQPTFQTALE